MAEKERGTEKAPHTNTDSVPNPKTQPQEWDELIDTLMKQSTWATGEELNQLKELAHVTAYGVTDDVKRIASRRYAALVETLNDRWVAQYSNAAYENALVVAFKNNVHEEIVSRREWVEHETWNTYGDEVRTSIRDFWRSHKWTGREIDAAVIAGEITSATEMILCLFLADDPEDVNTVYSCRLILRALKAIAINRGDDTPAGKSYRQQHDNPNGYEQAESYWKWAWPRRWTLKRKEKREKTPPPRQLQRRKIDDELQGYPNNAARTLFGSHPESHEELYRNGTTSFNAGNGERTRLSIEIADKLIWPDLAGLNLKAPFNMSPLNYADGAIYSAIATASETAVLRGIPFDDYKLMPFPFIWRQVWGKQDLELTESQAQIIARSILRLRNVFTYIKCPKYENKTGRPFMRIDEEWPGMLEGKIVRAEIEGRLTWCLLLLEELAGLRKYSEGIEEIETISMTRINGPGGFPVKRDSMSLAVVYFLRMEILDMDRQGNSETAFPYSTLYTATGAVTPNEKKKAVLDAKAFLTDWTKPKNSKPGPQHIISGYKTQGAREKEVIIYSGL